MARSEKKKMQAKILIVEDDDAVCRLFKKLASDLGLEVFCAHSSPSGTVQSFKENFEYAIIDLGISQDDGLDLADQLNIPNTIITSGNVTEEAQARCKERGWSVLQKGSFDIANFQELIFGKTG
jgi:CheY-like chemotaxis protein